MKKTKISMVLAAALMFTTLFSGFTNYSGIGDVSYESNQTIAPGVKYTHMEGNNASAGGVVRIHTIDLNSPSGIIKPYIFDNTITQKSTLSHMANTISAEGYKVVAGINGDIYDTASGTSKGMVFHNGILYTGGYEPSYMLMFDENGRASLTNDTINYSVSFQRYTQIEVTPPEGIDPTSGSDSTQTEEPVVEPEPVFETIITDKTQRIGFFNVPHGGANGLHLYNSRYASATKTTETSGEVVLTIKNGTRADLKAGQSIEATVTSVNPNAKNTAIADNQLVLSTKKGSATYDDISNMVPGSDVVIKVEVNENSPLLRAKEGMGVYHVLSLNGTAWTTDKTLNPRTCVGIKEDGSVILYIVDGRQSSYSKGMNAVDINSYLMSIGCVSVVNLDGGGSTTMIAREKPGISDNAEVVNKPSDGSPRSVTNGLFLVYASNEDGGEASSIAVYPAATLLMPGMTVQLSAYGVDPMYEKAALPEGVKYSSEGGFGTVTDSGLFTAAAPGKAVIIAKSGNINGQAIVEVVDDISFGLNKSSLTIEPGETFDFNVIRAIYGNSEVTFKDSLFDWSCSPEIGTIDANGLFTAVSDKASHTGDVVVKYGSRSAVIPVTVKYTPPVTASFTDVANHWAKEWIMDLAAEGIISGMTETTFEPDTNLTRAQFLTLLSKIDSDEDMSAGGANSFKDVSAADWFYGNVNWGVAKGIVNGMGDGTFAPDAKVSREQMCVMVCNYYKHKGLTWDMPETAITFKDKNKMDDWALSSIVKVVSEGIMTGRPDGTFDPLGSATRAEAARIIYLVKEIFLYQTEF